MSRPIPAVVHGGAERSGVVVVDVGVVHVRGVPAVAVPTVPEATEFAVAEAVAVTVSAPAVELVVVVRTEARASLAEALAGSADPRERTAAAARALGLVPAEFAGDRFE